MIGTTISTSRMSWLSKEPRQLSGLHWPTTPRNGSAPYKYLALYEIEGDPADALAALNVALKEGMFISDALGPTPEDHLYVALRGRVEASN